MKEDAEHGPPARTVVTGQVRSGVGDASRWLARFNAEYRRKVGMAVYPGSLNVALGKPFDWFAPALQPHVVWFGREEYGGERDILLMPCTLRNLQEQRAFLWSTTSAARDRDDSCVVEVIAPIGLRTTYGLRDGDPVVIELPGASDAVTAARIGAPAG